MFEKVEADGHGFLVGDLEGVVWLESFEVRGNAALADPFRDRAAFSLQLAIRVIVEERRAGRVGKTDRDIGISLAKRLGDAGQRSPCSDRRDEAVDPAASLLPDFGT